MDKKSCFQNVYLLFYIMKAALLFMASELDSQFVLFSVIANINNIRNFLIDLSDQPQAFRKDYRYIFRYL